MKDVTKGITKFLFFKLMKPICKTIYCNLNHKLTQDLYKKNFLCEITARNQNGRLKLV